MLLKELYLTTKFPFSFIKVGFEQYTDGIGSTYKKSYKIIQFLIILLFTYIVFTIENLLNLFLVNIGKFENIVWVRLSYPSNNDKSKCLYILRRKLKDKNNYFIYSSFIFRFSKKQKRIDYKTYLDKNGTTDEGDIWKDYGSISLKMMEVT